MTQSTEQEQQLHQLLELVLTELDRKAIPIAYMQEIDRKGKAFIEQAARRAPVVPQCPFPCGWKNLHKLVVAEGAFLAKSLNECEPITTHQRDVVMRVVHYGIEMARSMLAAAPQPPEAGCSVSNGETQAAPVQLPEPAAWRYTDARGHYRYRGMRHGFAAEYPLLKPVALYTEQQVRELLAAHGIGKDKA